MIRPIHVPLNGGPDVEIPRTGELRPANIPGPNGVGNDGRIVMPLGTSTWYWPPGIIDPVSGAVTRLPVDYIVDYHALNWTPDGKVMGLGLGLRAKIWKFKWRRLQAHFPKSRLKKSRVLPRISWSVASIRCSCKWSGVQRFTRLVSMSNCD